MLIKSSRHTQDDLDVWEAWDEVDSINGNLITSSKIESALEVIYETCKEKSYVSVSWGKDSVTILHLCHLAGVDIPAVWIKESPMHNPGCEKVRDKFLEKYNFQYHEVVCDYGRVGFLPFIDQNGDSRFFHAMAHAVGQVFGKRITGIRAQESKERKLRMMKHGMITRNTSCPIGWWKTEEIFAYLKKFDLPVHQNYAMTQGGLWERNKIRTDCIAGRQGNGIGRVEWEQHYYPDIVNLIVMNESLKR